LNFSKKAFYSHRVAELADPDALFAIGAGRVGRSGPGRNNLRLACTAYRQAGSPSPSPKLFGVGINGARIDVSRGD